MAFFTDFENEVKGNAIKEPAAKAALDKKLLRCNGLLIVFSLFKIKINNKYQKGYLKH